MQIPEYGCIETRCYQTWMGKDGIARTVVKQDAEIGLQDAHENSKVINQLIGPEKFALIIDSIRVIFDAPVAWHFMYAGTVSDRVAGTLGTITSIIGIYQLWK